MKITRSILLIAFLMLFYRAFGQPAERLIRIQITPNHKTGYISQAKK